MSTIEKINQLGKSGSWMGYEIILSDKKITCKIDNEQNCCETFGAYLRLNEKFVDINDVEIINEFIGANVSNIDVGNIDKNDETDESSICCTITTSNGQIAILLYNQHNGYYEHEFIISIGDQIINGCI
jgi:hypothetical protein